MKIIKRISALVIILALLSLIVGCKFGGTSAEMKSVINQAIKPKQAEYNLFLEYTNAGKEETYSLSGHVLQDYTKNFMILDSSLVDNELSVQKIAWYFKPNKYGIKLYQCIDDINWSLPLLSTDNPIDKVMNTLSPSLTTSFLKYVKDIEKDQSYKNEKTDIDVYSGVIKDSDIGLFLPDTLLLTFFGIVIDDPTITRDIADIDVVFYVEPANNRLIKMKLDMSSTISQLVRRYGMRMLEGNMFEGVSISTCELNIDLSDFDNQIDIIFPEELSRLEEGS